MSSDGIINSKTLFGQLRPTTDPSDLLTSPNGLAQRLSHYEKGLDKHKNLGSAPG